MNYYSPHTLEHIDTDNPAPWMGATEKECPPYDKQTQSAFFRDNDWVIETNPLGPTLQELKDRKLSEVNQAFEEAAQALTDGYPASERMTWPTQQAEALAWEANNGTPTPYLDGIADSRGIDYQTMREITLAQVQAFMAASQQLVGKRQKLRDAISDATDETELEEIQW